MTRSFASHLSIKHLVLSFLLSPLSALAFYAPLSTLNGNGADDWFGSAATGVGDVNKDGYDDVVVGVSFDDNNGTNSGSVRVVSGANGTTLYEFNGDGVNDYMGWSVSNAGDVNNDTYPDIIAGAFGDDNNGISSGIARVYSGANGAVLHTFTGTAYSEFGYAVAAAGDVNNDGYDDVIVGAYRDDNASGVNTNDTGRVQVFSGSNGSVLHTFVGDSSGDWFGYALDGNADVNNDGYSDVIVGSYAGGVKVFSGQTGAVLYNLNGVNGNDWFGTAVGMAGDVNNDGYDDFIVGAYGVDTNGLDSGNAVVYSGLNGAVLYTLNGDNAGDYFGRAVSGAGDINKDGYADFIVGAHNDDNNGANSGSAKVYSGVDGSVLYGFSGNRAGDYFGFSVSEAGDVDGDTYVDIIVGAYLTDSAVIDSGSAYIFSGAVNAGLLDSDGDLVADSADPFDSNAAEWQDTDSDGTGNNTDTDDDGDGMPDVWENNYRLNALVNNATDDADADGINNLQEYLAGSNPIDVSNLIDKNDFDADGVSDILLRSTSSGNWRLFSMINGVSSSNTGYSNAVAGTAWQVAATEDFDADGDTDVLLRNSSTGAWTMYETDGGVVIWSTTFNAYANPSWAVASIADFDANGIKDVLLRNTVTGVMRVFYVNNLATTSNANMALYSVGWSVLATEDFDGDGDADILMRSNSQGYWRMFTVSGGVVASNSALPLYGNANWTLQVAKDLDNDGDSDIVMRGPAGDWRVFNMQNNAVVGDAAFGMYLSLSWSLDHVNDVNNDGDTDLILRSTTGDWRLFNIQDCAVSSNAALALYTSTAWQTADTVDVDGNGVEDIILNNTSTGAWRAFMINAGVITSNTSPGLYTNTDWTLQNK